MVNRESTPHPAAILGVSTQATEAEIRSAYLKKIKENPPERSPETFERIRDAYSVLSDPFKRIECTLLQVDPEEPVTQLLEKVKTKKNFAGPAPWLRAIKEEKS